MAQRGGKRPGAGRKPGSLNRATILEKKTIAELAKDLAPEALDALARVMRDGAQSASAVVAAANSILDRAYGKPFAAEPEPDDEAEPVTWQISVRAAKGQIRVTQPERAASDLSEGA
jgi:hypothetical protein